MRKPLTLRSLVTGLLLEQIGWTKGIRFLTRWCGFNLLIEWALPGERGRSLGQRVLAVGHDEHCTRDADTVVVRKIARKPRADDDLNRLLWTHLKVWKYGRRPSHTGSAILQYFLQGCRHTRLGSSMRTLRALRKLRHRPGTRYTDRLVRRHLSPSTRVGNGAVSNACP